MNPPTRLLGAVLLLLAARPALATTTQPPERRVETARRVAETQRDAVARIEILDGETILRRGVRDVGEALQTLPGIQVVELPDGRRRLMMDGWVGRALFCVNGRPVPRGVDGELDLGELPVSVDELVRIEIARQPMTHVFGSQAEGGVINLVTRRLDVTGGAGTVAVRLLENGQLGGQASAVAAYAAERVGAYGNGSVMAAPQVVHGSVMAAQRRSTGAQVGAAFRLHPAVLVRAEANARQFELDAGPLDQSKTFRASAAAEAVFRFERGDTLHVEMRGGSVTGQQVRAGQDLAPKVWEQGASIRYLGQPLGRHFVQVEAGVLGEWGGDTPGGGFSRQRLRATGMLADTWLVGSRFALEGALRLETSDRFIPALGPSLALRYEPFTHFFLRSAVAAGYRYPGLIPGPSPVPWTLGGSALAPGSHDSARSARVSVSYEPDAQSSATMELFRTDFSSSPLGFQVGGGSIGTNFTENPLGTDAHVQGLRLHWVLWNLPSGTGVAVGYVFLHQALDDIKLARLPYAPTHSGTLRAWWQPTWLALGIETGAEALLDRVGPTGAALAPQVLLHVGLRKALGPVECFFSMDDATRVVDGTTGPREGRSVRVGVRAVRW